MFGSREPQERHHDNNDHRRSRFRHPLSDVPPARWLGCDESRPGLLGRLLHRRDFWRRPRRPRACIHARAWYRALRPRHRSTCTKAGRPFARWNRQRPGRVLARAWSATRQLRWLGPEKGIIHMAAAALVNGVWDLLAKNARSTIVALSGRHVAGTNRQRDRLPTHQRCADARPGARRFFARAFQEKRSALNVCDVTGMRRTRLLPGGSAIRTTKFETCAAPQSPKDGRESR